MGEQILILTFVVIVIGGLGSIKGALIGALLVGVADTMGRVLLPDLFALFFRPSVADGVGGAIGSMVIYLLMAGVLFYRPRGLFGSRAERGDVAALSAHARRKLGVVPPARALDRGDDTLALRVASPAIRLPDLDRRLGQRG